MPNDLVKKAINEDSLIRAKISSDRSDKLLISGIAAHQELLKSVIVLNSGSLIAIPAFYATSRGYITMPHYLLGPCILFFVLGISSAFTAFQALASYQALMSVNSEQFSNIYLNIIKLSFGIDVEKSITGAEELRDSTFRKASKQDRIARWCTVGATLAFGLGSSFFLYSLSKAELNSGKPPIAVVASELTPSPSQSPHTTAPPAPASPSQPP